MRNKGLIIVLTGLLLIGCGGKGPQRPSHRMGEDPMADSIQLELLKMNGRLASEADKELRHIVKESGEDYALNDRGTWVLFIDRGDEGRRKVRRNEECDVHMRVYSLSGELYQDIDMIAKIGQNELPPGIDWNIFEWYHGAKVKLLVPWYSAYGMKGTDVIPAYENVMIELEVK